MRNTAKDTHLHIREEIPCIPLSAKGFFDTREAIIFNRVIILIMRQKISIRALIKRDNKFLLGRRGSGRSTILGKYELPGGSLDFKEQPRDALRRYVYNQVGTKVETTQLIDVISFIDPDDPQLQYVFVVYEASLVAGNLVAGGRYDKYVWEKLQNIQHNKLTNSTVVLLSLINSEDTNSVIDESIANSQIKNTTDTAIIYSDGGSRGNPGPSASAYIIMDSNEQIITEAGAYLGVTTNNQAEYKAVKQALEKARQINLKNIDCRLDSSLVVNQLNGIYKIKNSDLWPIYEDIKSLMTHFEKITFSHVRREFNQLADVLVNKTLDEHE